MGKKRSATTEDCQPSASTSQPAERDESIRFRNAEFSYLKNLLCHNTYPGDPKTSVFISGSHGSGKSVLVRTLEDLCSPFCIFIDCAFFSTESEIVSDFSFCLQQILEENFEGSIVPKITCAKFRDLFRKAHKTNHLDLSNFQATLILDSFDHLDNPSDYLRFFASYQESVDFRFNLVVVSRGDLLSTCSSFDCSRFIEIHLPNYDRSQLKALIEDTFFIPKGDKQAKIFIGHFVDTILNTFLQTTKDCGELIALSHRFYPNFIDPIINKGAKLTDLKPCHASLQPFLRDQLQGVEDVSSEISAENMPKLLRLVLISGFLCSYNPAKSDARMVAKQHERVKKKAGPNAGRKKVPKEKRLTRIGPQNFGLNRMTEVLDCLVKDGNLVEICPVQVSVDVNTLCETGLFVRIGAEDVLDNPKYKCVCGKKLVKVVGSSVGIDVERLLFDNVQND